MKAIILSIAIAILAPFSFAGEKIIPNIPFPDIPNTEDNWLDHGSIWTFGYYDVDTEDSGIGLRLAYDISDSFRMRFDYIADNFEFSDLETNSVITVSMRSDIIDFARGITTYVIAGANITSLETFDMEYIVGGGAEYNFKNGARIFAEYINAYPKDGGPERNEVKVGIGVDFDKIGSIFKLFNASGK
jgi:hypothetical protein